MALPPWKNSQQSWAEHDGWKVRCGRSMGMGLHDHFRVPRVLRADSFWCQRHQPLAFIYMISHGSSLSRECQYMSCNYRRNTHGVMRILNACWFNYDLSTHLFIMSTSGWCCCVKSTEDDVYVYSGASICEQIWNSWWQYVQFTFYIYFFHWSIRARGKICHQICGSREHFFVPEGNVVSLVVSWPLKLKWHSIFVFSIIYMLLNTLKWVNSVNSGLRRCHYTVC